MTSAIARHFGLLACLVLFATSAAAQDDPYQKNWAKPRCIQDPYAGGATTCVDLPLTRTYGLRQNIFETRFGTPNAARAYLIVSNPEPVDQIVLIVYRASWSGWSEQYQYVRVPALGDASLDLMDDPLFQAAGPRTVLRTTAYFERGGDLNLTLTQEDIWQEPVYQFGKVIPRGAQQ